MTSDGGRAPRSLADWLRSASDADLGELLRVRPDLMTPVPPDFTVLSARAAARHSVLAALDKLTAYEVEILEVLCALPEPVALSTVESVIAPTDDAHVRVTVEQLRRLALIWGDDDDLHVVRTVHELLLEPAGLGPPVIAAFGMTSTGRLRDLLETLGLPAAPDRHTAIEHLATWAADADAVQSLLAGATDDVRDVLARLTWGPPTGFSSGPRGPAVRWALEHGLLAAQDDRTVVLPREVALALRDGLIARQTHPVPPVPDTVPGDADRSAHAATAHAAAFVRAVEELLEAWSLDRPALLRGGGVGVRDVRRTAARLDRPDTEIALLAEIAYAAGLLAASPSGEWLPTPAYDRWCDTSDAARWATLAAAWLSTSRVPGLVGARDDRDRALNPLAPELDRAPAARIRATVLAVLAELPPGASTTVESVTARLQWLSPRRAGRLHQELVSWTLAEAEQIGVTGAGALSPAGARIASGDVNTAADTLAALLPDPVDHVLLQADLTAVAPGPLTRELARELALSADVESTGHATVYRFSEASVRRALDAGRTAADVHDLLARHSRTPVPQPLSYLIDDVARRHGRIRVGVASSYIRCDDPAVLAELLSARQVRGLGLRKLAPTVIAAEAAPDRVLDVLREAGYAPAAESAAGDVVVARRDARRTPPTAPPAPVTEPAPPSDRLLGTAVHALRAGDRAATTPRRPVPVTDPPSGVMPSTSSSRTLTALQDAAREGRSLWIGYVNAQGRATQRVVEPTSVEGGYLRAYDHLRDEVRTFAVHRITGVAELVEEEA